MYVKSTKKVRIINCNSSKIVINIHKNTYAYRFSAFELDAITLNFFKNNLKQSIRTMAVFFLKYNPQCTAFYCILCAEHNNTEQERMP